MSLHNSIDLSRLLVVIPTFFLIVTSCLGPDRPLASESAKEVELPSLCPTSPAIETDGKRRLALVVGVGSYASREVQDLQGPANDARRIYDFLTEKKGGYGFPAENVCLLVDDEATTEVFRTAFEQTMVNRAQKGDVGLLFFAGHGSRAQDVDGDEPDDWDETLLFHDARSGGVEDLLDDELNAMLARFHAKTDQLTVIFDACNSASSVRDGSALKARYQPPSGRLANRQTKSDSIPVKAGTAGSSAKDGIPENLPGLVSFSAASDNTPAFERNGAGIFTSALLEVLQAGGSKPLTYAQAARRIRPLVAARSYQVPYFQGDLERVFLAESRPQRPPLAWDVTAVGQQVELSGPPQPSMGVGAELRIYDGAAKAGSFRDPSKSKATVTVIEGGHNGINAVTRVVSVRPAAPNILPGDLAILVSPATDLVKLKVRLRPRGEQGGLPRQLSQAIELAITAHPEAADLIEATDADGDFELAQDPSKNLVLWGPQGIRGTWAKGSFDGDVERVSRNVVRSLWNHARQRALLALRGEGGQDFEDQETLQVELVPAAKQTPCAGGSWQAAGVNQPQEIPLCHRWQIRVAVDERAPLPLLVGGMVLSSDGEMMAFPRSSLQAGGGRAAWYLKLEPGQSHVFQSVFEGRPPVGVWDTILVLGTQESNPVDWSLLAEAGGTRSVEARSGSPLLRTLDRYLRPDTRGQLEIDQASDTTWTLTSVPMQVNASWRFSAQEARTTVSVDTLNEACDERLKCSRP